MTERLLEIGNGFIDAGKYKEAITYFNKVIDTEKENPKAFELRGVAHYLLLNAEEAITDFSKSIEYDHTNHLAYSNRGHVFLDKQDYERAAADFTAALSIVPENVHYKLNVVYALILLRKTDEALRMAEEALETEPSNNYALLCKANCLTTKKDYKTAVKLYQQILDNNYPPTKEIFNDIGFCQSYTGQLRQAKNNFSLAIDMDASYAYPWNNLGYVYYLEKNYAEALRLINHAIELDASNSWGYKNRAIVYLALNEKEKALTDLKHALELGYAKDYDDEVETILANNY